LLYSLLRRSSSIYLRIVYLLVALQTDSDILGVSRINEESTPKGCFSFMSPHLHRVVLKTPHRKIRKDRKVNKQMRTMFRTTQGRCTSCNDLLLLTKIIIRNRNNYQQPATICKCGVKNYA
jgi:hypothetical protein